MILLQPQDPPLHIYAIPNLTAGLMYMTYQCAGLMWASHSNVQSQSWVNLVLDVLASICDITADSQSMIEVESSLNQGAMSGF